MAVKFPVLLILSVSMLLTAAYAQHSGTQTFGLTTVQVSQYNGTYGNASIYLTTYNSSNTENAYSPEIIQGQTVLENYTVYLINGTAAGARINLLNAAALANNGIYINFSLAAGIPLFFGTLRISVSPGTSVGTYNAILNLSGLDPSPSNTIILISVVNESAYAQSQNSTPIFTTINPTTIAYNQTAGNQTINALYTTATTVLQHSNINPPKSNNAGYFTAAAIAVVVVAALALFFRKQLAPLIKGVMQHIYMRKSK